MAPVKEIRITDAKTGGQKGMKMIQLGALDPQALMVVAEVAGFGTVKYARYNFFKGFDWSLSYDALQRHLHAFWGGENLDPESKLPHLAHACWHTLCLLTFSLRGRGTDDRFPTGDQPETQPNDRTSESDRASVDAVPPNGVGGVLSSAARTREIAQSGVKPTKAYDGPAYHRPVTCCQCDDCLRYSVSVNRSAAQQGGYTTGAGR